MPCENICVPETAMLKEVRNAGNTQRRGYVLASALLLPNTGFNTHTNTQTHGHKLNVKICGAFVPSYFYPASFICIYAHGSLCSTSQKSPLLEAPL